MHRQKVNLVLYLWLLKVGLSQCFFNIKTKSNIVEFLFLESEEAKPIYEQLLTCIRALHLNLQQYKISLVNLYVTVQGLKTSHLMAVQEMSVHQKS